MTCHDIRVQGLRYRLHDDVMRGQYHQATESDRAAGKRAHAILHALYRDSADHASGTAGAAECLRVVSNQLRGE